MKKPSGAGTWGLALALALTLGTASCGSGSGGSCGTVAACGGDPTGTWKFTSDCAPGAASAFKNAKCPAATANANLSATGTISFGADKSYSESITSNGSVVLMIPASCLPANGTTCAQLGPMLQGSGGTGASPFSSATCSGTTSCTCNLVIAPTTTADTGTWASAGTSIDLTSAANGPGGGGPYCVKGNELHLLSVDMTMSMGPMGTATITEDIVGSKQ